MNKIKCKRSILFIIAAALVVIILITCAVTATLLKAPAAPWVSPEESISEAITNNTLEDYPQYVKMDFGNYKIIHNQSFNINTNFQSWSNRNFQYIEDPTLQDEAHIVFYYSTHICYSTHSTQSQANNLYIMKNPQFTLNQSAGEYGSNTISLRAAKPLFDIYTTSTFSSSKYSSIDFDYVVYVYYPSDYADIIPNQGSWGF